MLIKLLLLTCLLHNYLVNCGLTVVNQWSELEFVFPTEAAKRTAIEKEYYIQQPINSVPLDVDIDYSGYRRRLFITIPRFGKGRPVTLGTLDARGRVLPYPDYTWHDSQGQNCDGFTSVFRVFIDKCKRLWVVDAGKIGNKFHCPPQVVAFDLRSDTVIYRHKFVKDISYTNATVYVTPIADVRSCRNINKTFIYAADVKGNSLGVVDVQRDRSWRLEHPAFAPNTDENFFDIAGEHFELNDGLLGLALSPLVREGRKLYFHPLASTSEYYVHTNFIQDSRFMENPKLQNTAIIKLPGQRTNQSAAEAMDDRGIMYFGIMNQMSIVCWNSRKEYQNRNFRLVDINNTTLQFTSDIKIVTSPFGGKELWVLTSRFQKFKTGTMTKNEINFRILTGLITDNCA